MKKTNDLTYLTVDYTYNWIKTIFITNVLSALTILQKVDEELIT